uniref:Putative beta-agarase n=1 Tax=uncultured bacterium Ad_095_K16_contig2 TaxID=1489294 RepID=A0A0B4N0R2_9BACT|nr:putative beta-agarase [uncultured bacterium Ad_095_K16_contig2]
MLRLREGEYACYSLNDVTAHTALEVSCFAAEPAALEISQDRRILGVFELNSTEDRQLLSGIRLSGADASALRLKAVRGTVDIETLTTKTDR